MRDEAVEAAALGARIVGGWVAADYEFYCRQFEINRENGNEAPESESLSFEAWFAVQPWTYQVRHRLT